MGTIRAPAGAPIDSDVLVLVHGGFWRWPYGRWTTWLVARDAVARGHTVLNLGYRRLGRFGGGGGWPNTFDDVVDALRLVAGQRPDAHLVVIGHSAGGHLALAAASRCPEAISGVVAVAAPTDLRMLYEKGSDPVRRLIAAAPAEDRFGLTSPIEMLPTGVPTICVHSDADTTVRPSSSRRYVAAAVGAGDDSRVVRVVDDTHLDALRPGKMTWTQSLAAAEELFAAARSPRATSPSDERVVGHNV